jgi:hypothetical protein
MHSSSKNTLDLDEDGDISSRSPSRFVTSRPVRDDDPRGCSTEDRARSRRHGPDLA